MKKGIATILISLFFSGNLFAQRGLYFNPVIRNGISSAQESNVLPGLPNESQSVYAIGTELGVGYSINKLRIQSGIGYQRSGFRFNSPTFPNASQQLNYYFNHLTTTLQLGYTLRNNKKLAIVPYLGVSYTYNYSARIVNKLPNRNINIQVLKGEALDKRFEKGSILAHTKVHLEYRFVQRAAFIFGPSFQYMIADIAKDGPTTAPEIKNHLLLFDVGFIWIIPNARKSGKNRMPSLFYN